MEKIKSQIKEIVTEAIDDALKNIDGVRFKATILFEDFHERSVQDQAEIAIELMLRNEYHLPKNLAEEIAANAVRRILPMLKA